MGAFNKQQTETNDYEQTSKFIKLNLLYFAIIFMCVIGLMSSCKKDEQQDNKLLTVQVKTEGLRVQQMKSWSLTDWVYNYNPNPYELTFVGSKGTIYKFNKTITELSAGFNISVLPDTYTITYMSSHGTGISNTLDISINDTKSITTSAGITLQGVNEDYLIVADITAQETNNWQMYVSYNNYLNLYRYTQGDNTYFYMYYNVEGNIDLKYQIYVNGWQDVTKTLSNLTKNNIYHITSLVNGGVGINIVPFTENLIGW